MSLDLATWKQSIHTRLKRFRAEMPALGMESVFGFLTTITLLPVVQAATQSGTPIDELLLLAGNVGGNLLAGELDKWRTRAGGQTDEKALADALLPELATRADLRQELEALWRNIHLAQDAKQSLAPADLETFFKRLTQERQTLIQGNYTALVGGSRNTVVLGENSVGLGERSTYIRDVHGNVTIQPAAPDPALPAKTNYLRALFHRCNALPLSALGGDENQSLYLQDVYIGLNTESQVAIDKSNTAPKQYGDNSNSRPLTALEAVGRTPRLALLGDPGSGKSTFIRELVARTAFAAEQNNAAVEGFPVGLIPVVITLRDLALALQTVATDSSGVPTDDALVLCFWNDLKRQLTDLDATAFLDALVTTFRNGTVLLVLDGLDELKDTLRPHINLLIAALLRRYPTLWRVIITCRKRSYLTPLAGFATEFLAPFTPDQIEAFVRRWYQGLYRAGYYAEAEAQHKAENLHAAALAPLLSDLAPNPMLLTTMAIIHQRDTRLPPERVKLYKLAVDNLLRRWHRHKEGTIAPEVQALLASELKLYEVVERLGYEAHLQQSTGKSQGDLKRGDLLDLLSRNAYFGSAALAEAFLDYIDVRAGLLLGRGGTAHDDHPRLYSFPHRTFQEYLAGCYMVRGRHRDRVARIQTHAQEGDYWQGAVQMGTEMLYFSQQETDVLDVAYDLAPPIEPRHAAQWRQAVWAAQMVALMGSARVEEDSQGRDPHYLSRLRMRITSLVQGDGLPALERVGAGNILATLDDPRFDAAHWYLPHAPLLGFMEIPTGSFTMGSNDDEDEKLIHHVSLPRYWMARYPVTVSQWQAYLQSSAQQPEDKRSVQGIRNHPVVRVSWHEALAYTTWLHEQMKHLAHLQINSLQHTSSMAAFWEGLADGRLRVILPSEAEWERAARFTDGRTYPWGGSITPEHANYDESNLGITNPVGTFPQGSSVEGVEDLSGNVWEWMRSLYVNYPYHARDGRENVHVFGLRVLRGGTFSDNNMGVRGASRSYDLPDYRRRDIGFRVCVSPVFF